MRFNRIGSSLFLATVLLGGGGAQGDLGPGVTYAMIQLDRHSLLWTYRLTWLKTLPSRNLRMPSTWQRIDIFHFLLQNNLTVFYISTFSFFPLRFLTKPSVWILLLNQISLITYEASRPSFHSASYQSNLPKKIFLATHLPLFQSLFLLCLELFS